MDCTEKFAKCTKTMEASAIREILKVVGQPGMRSLAGGMPAPESFPIDIIHKLNKVVIKKYGDSVFQYGITEGFDPLRAELSKHLRYRGIKAGPESVYISSGSQGSIDIVPKILIDEGDVVLVESPTYLAALKSFKSYGAKIVGIKADENGVIPEDLEKAVIRYKPKFTYLIPNFQNPTGATITLERRKKIAEIIKNHNHILLEDDPYHDLRYSGEHLPTIQSMAPKNTIYLGSFSKVFAPGLRLGYYIAPKEIASVMVSAKQAVDMFSSSYSQALACEYILGGYIEKQIRKNVALYKPRMQAMLQALDKYMPEGYSWTKPEGGMFVWATGPNDFDAKRLYPKAIKNKVAYVPGCFFYEKENMGKNTMRLNFSNVDEKTITEAIADLSKIL